MISFWLVLSAVVIGNSV
uniref:Uncharacterized protein n=1 Tax=Anguilla anguilla TaxID=7936 RepID=A0A0E9Y194_ANGAN